MKHIVIIGATSSIAEHCARLWVQTPVHLTLVGRNPEKLDAIAQDLRVRSPESTITTAMADFFDSIKISQQVDALCHMPIDIALIAHGSLPDQRDCQNDLKLCQETLEINAVSPVLFAEAFAKHMERHDHGTLAIIGSVAGDRGRKSNYVYGAAKGLVMRYAEGLRHRLAQSKVNVVLIKPGPTNTPMTSAKHVKKNGLADVRDVAQEIVKGINSGASIVYAPGKWRYVMLVVRNIPNFIFKHIDI